ncbi:hypothetical protein, partial [[Kitasatospora] papulosa]|uniref:hypothetical protein n=1 Tax=[Kitasatospora] papulosa TaxID=1464011 RepID=UPI0036C162D3
MNVREATPTSHVAGPAVTVAEGRQTAGGGRQTKEGWGCRGRGTTPPAGRGGDPDAQEVEEQLTHT